MKRARLIYNPTSGREEMRKRLPEILERLESYGLETSCHATNGPGDAARAAHDAVDRGFDLIIAAGGDGTLNEVINGLAPAELRPPLGILPMGTSNDLARALGIPRNWEYACDIIGAGFVKGLDIGSLQLDGGDFRYFMNNVAGGVITELSYEVPSKLKTILGQLAYYVKGLEKLPKLRPVHIQLTMDGHVYENDVMLFLIANSGCVAGIEQLFPMAAYDDGMLDVLVVEKMTLPEFIFLATASVRGEHVGMPGIKFFKTNTLTARSDHLVQLNVDGEFGGNAPFKVQTLARHIHVFVDEHGSVAAKENKGLWNWPFLRGTDGVSDE
jgi:diacylglycerol kinase (ATP)